MKFPNDRSRSCGQNQSQVSCTEMRILGQRHNSTPTMQYPCLLIALLCSVNVLLASSMMRNLKNAIFRSEQTKLQKTNTEPERRVPSAKVNVEFFQPKKVVEEIEPAEEMEICDLSESFSEMIEDAIEEADQPEYLEMLLGNCHLDGREDLGSLLTKTVAFNRPQTLAFLLPRIHFIIGQRNREASKLLVQAIKAHQPEVCQILLAQPYFKLDDVVAKNNTHEFWTAPHFHWNADELIDLLKRYPTLEKLVPLGNDIKDCQSVEAALTMIHFTRYWLSTKGQNAHVPYYRKYTALAFLEGLARHKYLNKEEQLTVIKALME